MMERFTGFKPFIFQANTYTKQNTALGSDNGSFASDYDQNGNAVVRPRKDHLFGSDFNVYGNATVLSKGPSMRQLYDSDFDYNSSSEFSFGSSDTVSDETSSSSSSSSEESDKAPRFFYIPQSYRPHLFSRDYDHKGNAVVKPLNELKRTLNELPEGAPNDVKQRKLTHDASGPLFSNDSDESGSASYYDDVFSRDLV